MNPLITSLQHPLIKHLVKLRLNHDYRFDEQSVVIEGVKLINEICQENAVKNIVVTDEKLIPKGISANRVLFVSDAVMKKISGTQSPEGIVAEIKLPPQANLEGKQSIIALDGINDPGNLGTLIRSALALGWQGCYILENSCDPYNDKALRAARGATFRLPIAMGSWDALKIIIKQNSLDPVVADLEGEEPSKITLKKQRLLVLGNEAKGPSPEALQICRKITIPMPGKMESLNVSVAGGILMYLLKL